jgi:predicted enzyme related to lactoylglutathione lyase
MNPVVHFEMPYSDKNRLVKFYSDTFGWKMKVLGKEMGDYVLARATDADENQIPKEPGRINGGFFPRTPENSNKYPSVVIAVDDVSEAIGKIKSAGGKVLGDPVDIPGTGKYVSFIDTEGNLASILHPLPMA